MVDPTSDLGTDVTEADAPRCGNCGDPVVEKSTHRAVTWIEDGEVQTRHFCDEACLDGWDDEQ
jgi:hypothetical protein